MNIYTLSCPKTNEIKYVGATISTLSKRLSQHKCDNRVNLRSEWINGLKKESLTPKIELLDIVQNDVWEQEEMFYISYFKYLGFDLVNMTKGGVGIEMTQAIRKKISKSKLGTKTKDSTKAKISIANKENRIGYYANIAPELIDGLRAVSKEKREMVKPKSHYYKPIIQFDLDNNVVAKWMSITECCDTNNFSKGNIIKVCKNKIRKDGTKCKTAYGYKWAYA